MMAGLPFDCLVCKGMAFIVMAYIVVNYVVVAHTYIGRTDIGVAL